MLRRILQFEAKRQAPAVAEKIGLCSSPQTKPSSKVAYTDALVTSKRQPALPCQRDITTIVINNEATVSANRSGDSPFEKMLTIVSQESGVDIGDLGNDTEWTEIGVDSLLLLQINSRVREEIEIDMDLEGLLVRFSTVGDLRKHFGSEAETAVRPKTEISAGTVEQALKTLCTTGTSRQTPLNLPVQNSASTFHGVLATISEVTGVAQEDLTDEVIFADIGVDSLMSLMLTTRLREELDLEIEHDTFWARFRSLGDLREWLCECSDDTETSSLRSSLDYDTDATTPIKSGTGAITPIKSDKGDTTPVRSGTVAITPTKPESIPADLSISSDITKSRYSVPAATSFVLRGSVKKARIILFFFPDGAGSATSYCSIPDVAPDVALVGLNSPYHRDPISFKCTIGELIDAYLEEIRRRQPTGPYHFAGWSAGGILAYQAAYILIMSGVEVEHLVLIDSPVPKGLDRLPHHFYEFLSDHKVFNHGANLGKIKPTPELLFPHFIATIDLLHDFIAKPLPEGMAPKTSLIWAGESILDTLKVDLPPHPDDTEGMKFLTVRHLSFSGNGWERLFPGEKLSISVAEGANHFSMMVSFAEYDT